MTIILSLFILFLLFLFGGGRGGGEGGGGVLKQIVVMIGQQIRCLVLSLHLQITTQGPEMRGSAAGSKSPWLAFSDGGTPRELGTP